MSKPLPDTPAGRAAAQKRKAADRARAYRERKKRAGAPLAAAVDKALSEALAFHIAKNGVNIGIDPVQLMRTTRLVLEREGFTPAEAAQAVAGRLSHRDEHLWTDHVPTLKPGPADRMRETVSGPWTTPMPAIVKHLAAI